ncbi:hypothetical protein F4556_006839 [Kitasatospora gansuensis]|uniref:Peptidase metallopeptidase domain-containing protein n=1 Tax=Kitasatospora gansuensis TaxID=258050 RepID=A0A7W7SIV7_9ACTN|nr:M12 family metallopeptidase [Kitasatospora gansuensis]MBB4951304.1 hypothetical protein [Kitasatospora gansuensis]
MVDTQAPASGTPLYCTLQPATKPELRPGLGPNRVRAILQIRTKWVNGTVLHYHFLNRTGGGQGPEQLDEVRAAFHDWKGLGIGLDFKEVDDASEAEVRIAFADDGSWSYVGRDVLTIGVHEPTMNFGWDLTTPWGRATARHETGHTLGLPHEHQNPYAGIVWDEEAVYTSLGKPPNSWTREETFNNILRKLSKQEVTGSTWDPESIMEYPFEPGLIKEPEKYAREGIEGPLSLSAIDKDQVLHWYPPVSVGPVRLEPGRSVPLKLSTGEQADFEITPAETRKYEVGTFGQSDVLLVLFEDVHGELRYVTGEDDSGADVNGRLSVRLFKGRRYVLRARLYSNYGSGETTIMYW